ncbi:MAG: endonuclease III [Limnochordaceae bacterium]|nr:endonuclease III [Limnochordaceae bacterium]
MKGRPSVVPAGHPPSPRRESKRARSQRLQAIVQVLAQLYPTVTIPLRHQTPWQLLVATILSAQCTDATVNKVTPDLFSRYPSAQALAQAPLAPLEALIHSTGFFHSKARALLATARQVAARPDRDLPRTLAELVALPGVGRKTANVLLSAAEIEKWPGWDARAGGLGIVVDTHVGRLARRLGLAFSLDPTKVEAELQTVVPPDEWAIFPLRLIYFGRQTCTSRNPDCPHCPLLSLCPAGPHHGETPWLATRGRTAVRAGSSRSSSSPNPANST